MCNFNCTSFSEKQCFCNFCNSERDLNTDAYLKIMEFDLLVGTYRCLNSFSFFLYGERKS